MPEVTPIRARSRVSQSYAARVTRQLGRIKMERGCEARMDDGAPCPYPITVPQQLGFDHRDPADKHGDFLSPAGFGTMSFMHWASTHDWYTEVLPEVAKCDVLCHNCHMLRTRREGHNGQNRLRRRVVLLPDPTLFEE